MVAIAPSAVLLSMLFASLAAADQPRDVLDAINHLSSALASGDPADAMTPFDRNMAGYDTLQDYFVGLTSSYQITNEAEVIDEQDSPSESELTLRWAVILTGRQSNVTTRKAAEVHVKLRLFKRQWKIVEFTPIDIFTP